MRTPDECRRIIDDLSEVGHRVIPTRDKKPIIAGYKESTTPYAPSERARWPWRDANGVARVIRPGEVLLDVDNHVRDGHTSNGLEDLAVFERLYGPLPEGPRQDSPTGGGFHRHFTVAEMPKQLPAALRLPNGQPSGIDVLHRGYRVQVVYDVDMFLNWVEPPRLPDAWLIPISKSVSRPWLPGDPLSDGIPLGQIPVGSNNYELNRRAFMRLLHTPFDPTVLEVLRAEALDAGILVDDIDRTFISVTADVALQWQLPSVWWLAVVDDGYLRNKRSAARLMAAATVIARLAVMHDRLTIGLSVRQLAEQLNCSAHTAHGLLRLLIARGWLEPEDGAYNQALRYTLVLPEFHKGDSPPLFAYEGRLCQEWKHWERLSAVSGHDAFARRAGETSLTMSDAKVLVACENSSKSITELKVATRLGQSTLYKTINQLEGAGLLVREEGTDKFALVRTPLQGALDSWFTSQNVPSRRDRRKAQHQADRLSWSEEPRRPRKAVHDPLAATPRASRTREPKRAARDTHKEYVEVRRRLDAKREVKSQEGESHHGQATTG